MASFDIAIIGAGINGCALAHGFVQKGYRVALFENRGIAGGGSGAAGAFISPKISKGGPLKEVMDAAYTFSLAFYNQTAPQHVTNAQQLHIAKFDDENEKVRAFEKATQMSLGTDASSLEAILQEDVKAYASVLLRESAVVDAPEMCRALAQGATVFHETVTGLERQGSEWQVGGITADVVVLATGAYDKVIAEPYIALRGVWGHRIDIQTSTRIPSIIHHRVSLAPTDDAGHSAIGATHDVHYHPQHSTVPYDVAAGRAQLLEKAQGTVALSDVTILKDHMGLRSGSNDYLPILGPLVDARRTLQRYPELLKGQKREVAEYCYHDRLYMINGTGGYGFVLAPWLAACLSAFLIDGIPLDSRLLPSRFFTRWVKSQK